MLCVVIYIYRLGLTPMLVRNLPSNRLRAWVVALWLPWFVSGRRPSATWSVNGCQELFANSLVAMVNRMRMLRQRRCWDPRQAWRRSILDTVRVAWPRAATKCFML